MAAAAAHSGGPARLSRETQRTASRPVRRKYAITPIAYTSEAGEAAPALKALGRHVGRRSDELPRLRLSGQCRPHDRRSERARLDRRVTCRRYAARPRLLAWRFDHAGCTLAGGASGQREAVAGRAGLGRERGRWRQLDRRSSRRRVQPGKPEVEELDAQSARVAVHQYVGRLEVAVDDTSAVGEVDGVGDSAEDRQGRVERHGADRGAVVRQRDAVEQLHDEVRHALVARVPSEIGNVDDGRVLSRPSAAASARNRPRTPRLEESVAESA